MLSNVTSMSNNSTKKPTNKYKNSFLVSRANWFILQFAVKFLMPIAVRMTIGHRTVIITSSYNESALCQQADCIYLLVYSFVLYCTAKLILTVIVAQL